jgi:soluble lytic murein transglycosylase
MHRYWGRITRGLWRKTFSSTRRPRALTGAAGAKYLVLGGLAVAGFAVWSFAAAPEPLMDLKAGVVALDAKRYQGAIASLSPLPKRMPELADYAAWFLASAQSEARNYPAVTNSLDPVWKQNPPSPLLSKSALLAADAYSQTGAFGDAVDVLRNNYAALNQPEGDLALAKAFEAASDPVSAAVYFQRVFYSYPLSAEAGQAEMALDRLKMALGAKFPPAMAGTMLGRALKLVDSGYAWRARKELEALIPQLGGADKDLARVRLGVAEYNAKDTAAAQRQLATLQNLAPEPDAERLYYLYLCARRLKDEQTATREYHKLEMLYPNATWRLQTLIANGDRLFLEHQPDQYEPVYRACYENFPTDPRAAVCHWRVTWLHYLRRQSDAADLLRDHLKLFPASENASAALYYLGRQSETLKDNPGARALYEEIASQYPNQYYAVVARERLAKLPPRGPKDVANAEAFLKTIRFPQRARTWNFEATSVMKSRIVRAKMLASIGLTPWAEGELRYGAEREGQPQLAAMELASLIGEEKPEIGLRYIKRYANGYLYVPFESAPRDFWKLAFPLPYKADLDRFSKANSLDPFLVAALIRQESEFDARAVSRASARGLTQIMPETGRELSRRIHLAPYSTARLFEPAVSLQLGTYYLKMVINQLNGQSEAALAAYNAGLSRAKTWLAWGDYREPAEFTETIPFTETRTYVQTIMRNADMYRRTYQ